MNYQQDNWALLLPLVEFAYNNAMSATTGISPFFTNKGYHPRQSTNLLAPSSSSEAQHYVADLDQLHSQLKVSITEAQECYQKAVDHQQMPSPAFRIGNHVYVKAKFFCTTRPSRKLAEKNLGPFEIIGTPGMHSVTVHLPQQFQGVHPVFHISQLEPTFPNPFLHREQPPPPPIELDSEMEYEVSEILDSKLDCHFKTGDVLRYLIHWAGYEGTDEETSWVAASDLANSPDLCASFHQWYPQKPGPHTKH